MDVEEITRLLNRAASGDQEAARQVFPAIYQELRRLASAKAARLGHGETLQTTALVHEAYLRILGRNPSGWDGVRHFYFTAARAMRDILVEEARRRASGKRRGEREQVSIESIAQSLESSPEDVLALDAALTRLEREDPDGHRLVLLRSFAGLSVNEAAQVLGASVRTTERKWRFLRVWLARELELPAT